MSYKFKTSAGILTKDKWYQCRGELVKVVDECVEDHYVYVHPSTGDAFSVMASSLSELPAELNGGKIEPLPIDPVKGKLYQFGCDPDFDAEHRVSFFDRMDGSDFRDSDGNCWSHCRPVPQELRVFGE